MKNVLVPTYRVPSVSSDDRKSSALSASEDRMSVRSSTEVWEKSAWMDVRLVCRDGGRFMLLLEFILFGL